MRVIAKKKVVTSSRAYDLRLRRGWAAGWKSETARAARPRMGVSGSVEPDEALCNAKLRQDIGHSVMVTPKKCNR
jgi:hypothetical protein